MFGGELFSQSLIAAGRTLPAGRVVASAQGTFVRPGDPDRALEFHVEPVRDGGTFSTRLVDARQDEQTVLLLSVSAQSEAPGLEFQHPMPVVPSPEDLQDPEELFAGDDADLVWIRALLGRNPIECRFVDWPPRASGIKGVPAHPHQRIWVRTLGEPAGDDLAARASVAYLSDLFLLATAVAPHGRTIQDADLQFATLDHSVWFHRRPDSGGWLLYDQFADWTGQGRALCHGAFYSRSGERVASVVQQALIRVRDTQTSSATPAGVASGSDDDRNGSPT